MLTLGRKTSRSLSVSSCEPGYMADVVDANPELVNIDELLPADQCPAPPCCDVNFDLRNHAPPLRWEISNRARWEIQTGALPMSIKKRACSKNCGSFERQPMAGADAARWRFDLWQMAFDLA